jgi:hypothetical protein
MSGKKSPLGDLEGVLIYSQGCKLLGTLYRARKEGRSPAAVILHGFPGLERNYDIAHALRKLGYHSLIFHYRGAWGSEGSYTFTGQIDDTLSALAALRSRPDVDPERILLVGHSMGSWLAINVGAIDKRVTGVVAISGIGDARKWGEQDKARTEYSLQFLKGMSFEEYVAERQMLVRKHNPVEKIGMISPRPVLIIHGDNDAVVNVENAYELYAAASEPKGLLIVKGADHVFSYQREEVIDRIVSWIT